MKLIPITERLPEVDQDVIAWNGKKLVAAKYVMRNIFVQEKLITEMQGRFETEKYPSEMDRSITTYWVGITHWMPAIIENPDGNN